MESSEHSIPGIDAASLYEDRRRQLLRQEREEDLIIEVLAPDMAARLAQMEAETGQRADVIRRSLGRLLHYQSS